MRRYITSARGYELGGRVCAHAYKYYNYTPGRITRGLQSKLLITPLSELSHNIILQVWYSLKSVTTTLGFLFSWLHNYTALHSSITLGNLASFPSYSCIVYNYDYAHALINATCAGPRLYR